MEGDEDEEDGKEDEGAERECVGAEKAGAGGCGLRRLCASSPRPFSSKMLPNVSFTKAESDHSVDDERSVGIVRVAAKEPLRGESALRM